MALGHGKKARAPCFQIESEINEGAKAWPRWACGLPAGSSILPRPPIVFVFAKPARREIGGLFLFFFKKTLKKLRKTKQRYIFVTNKQQTIT